MEIAYVCIDTHLKFIEDSCEYYINTLKEMVRSLENEHASRNTHDYIQMSGQFTS